jgi:hypothetical protein
MFLYPQVPHAWIQPTADGENTQEKNYIWSEHE